MSNHPGYWRRQGLLFLVASCDTANSSLPKNGYAQHKGLPVQMKNLFYY
jgi:hypothetical protein